MTSILFLTDAIYCNIFRCNYDRNEKYFRSFFLHFLNLHSILNIFKEKMTLIADLFLNWRNPKYVVGEMSKNSRFRGPFDNWHGNRFERLLKSERQHRLFVNPLTAYDKYSVLNRGNLFHYLQMQLSQQGKIFSEFFLQFSKCRFLNLRTP